MAGTSSEKRAMKVGHILGAAAALALVAGCADQAYGPEPGYGPGPVVEYDGWYDGYYGPIYDGYWNGGVFWYRTGNGGRWRRGDPGHFRRDAAPGFNHIHGQMRGRPPRNPH
jgi:hypothetical protein